VSALHYYLIDSWLLYHIRDVGILACQVVYILVEAEVVLFSFGCGGRWATGDLLLAVSFCDGRRRVCSTLPTVGCPGEVEDV